MSLVISKKSTRKIKIDAVEPGDLLDSKKHSFVAEFKFIDKDIWQESMESDARIDDVLRLGLVGFEGIKDTEGNDVGFSEDLVDSLLELPWITSALFKAQLAVQGGLTQAEIYKKERRKN